MTIKYLGYFHHLDCLLFSLIQPALALSKFYPFMLTPPWTAVQEDGSLLKYGRQVLINPLVLWIPDGADLQTVREGPGHLWPSLRGRMSTWCWPASCWCPRTASAPRRWLGWSILLALKLVWPSLTCRPGSQFFISFWQAGEAWLLLLVSMGHIRLEGTVF